MFQQIAEQSAEDLSSTLSKVKLDLITADTFASCQASLFSYMASEHVSIINQIIGTPDAEDALPNTPNEPLLVRFAGLSALESPSEAAASDAPSEISLHLIAPDVLLADVIKVRANYLPSDVSLESLLGEGSYGTVHRGKILSGDDLLSFEVAVKLFSLDLGTATRLEEFSQEAVILNQISSDYIISLLGVYSLGIGILIELAPFGDLYMLIHDPLRVLKPMNQFLNDQDRLSIERRDGASLDQFETVFSNSISEIQAIVSTVPQLVPIFQTFLSASTQFWKEPSPFHAQWRGSIFTDFSQCYADHLFYNYLLPLPFILRLGWDIAQALNYIHSLDPPIVNLDLKSPNILLFVSSFHEWNSPTPIAKLSDWGMARTYESPSTSTSPQEYSKQLENALPRWAPPEYQNLNFSPTSDIYSLGLCLWEACSRKLPFDHIMPGPFFESSLADSVLRGDRPPLDILQAYYPQSFLNLIRLMWHRLPVQRASADSVLKELKAIALQHAPELIPFLH